MLAIASSPNSSMGWRVAVVRCYRQLHRDARTGDKVGSVLAADLPRVRNKCLLRMEGEMHGKVDLLNARITRRSHRRRARPLWLGRSRRRSSGMLRVDSPGLAKILKRRGRRQGPQRSQGNLAELGQRLPCGATSGLLYRLVM